MRRITPAGVRKRLLGALRAAKAAALSPNGIAPYLPPSGRFETYPGGFNNWVARYTGKNRSHYPAQWRRQLAAIAADERPVPRVGVLMHVHFPELVDEILDGLTSIPVPFDLIVSNSSGSPLELDTGPLELLRHASVFDLANHGRDMLPLASIVNTGILNPYDLILKVHTKKSPWRADHDVLDGSGEEWRRTLLDALLGDEQNVRRILTSFVDHPDMGLLTAPGSIAGPEHWGGDYEITRDLLRRVESEFVPGELRFAAGSMYWIRGFLLQGLASLRLSSEDFEPEAGQIDGTTAHGLERAIGLLTVEAGYRLHDAVPEAADDRSSHFEIGAPRTPRARVLPFYLPQFHSFPENDLWWGPGFTEWSNVSSARPVFHGHSQPLLPSRLGFYDLSNDATRLRQRALAAASGIEGFMYYYYWFAGKRLMDGPVSALLASDDDTPFCLMWANENWTRRWDGSDSDVLIGQDHDRVPATRFIEDVADFLRDPRYIRVDGRPLLAVYRITQIPDFESVIDSWRAYARAEGIGELYILTVDVGGGMQGLDADPQSHGLDGALEFPPHNTYWEFQDLTGLHPDARFKGRVMRYRATVASAEAQFRFPVAPWRHPGVMVNFDNTARRQWQPDVWYGSNPYTFRRWLDLTLTAVSDREPERRIVFINAWNEWAEGAMLEPSVRHGEGYLLAVRDALLR